MSRFPKANYTTHGGKRIYRSSFDRFMDDFKRTLFKKEDVEWRSDLSPKKRPVSKH